MAPGVTTAHRRHSEDLPPGTKPSFKVDLAQLRAGIRPAIRTEINRGDTQRATQWARRFGLYAVWDAESFVAFSRKPALARRVMVTDRSSGDHTAVLGRLLGYPECCCRAAARVGESELDRWARSQSSKRFLGRFAAIDTQGYVAGAACVSHIPCSPRCLASLAMASALIGFVSPRRVRGNRFRANRRSVGYVRGMPAGNILDHADHAGRWALTRDSAALSATISRPRPSAASALAVARAVSPSSANTASASS